MNPKHDAGPMMKKRDFPAWRDEKGHHSEVEEAPQMSQPRMAPKKHNQEEEDLEEKPGKMVSKGKKFEEDDAEVE